MLGVTFARREQGEFKLLCLGAHSDDIEIGCGGTVLRLLEEIPEAQVHWVVLGAGGKRGDEAVESANCFLAKARRKEILVQTFRDGFFPYVGGEIKQFFEHLKGVCQPDLVLTHYREDRHQDHRLVSDLTWNTYRNHCILEYEIPKYDGDLGAPNFFVPLSEAACRAKIETLLRCFRSQSDKNWFREDTFFSLLRMRGLECNSPERYAEAFYSRKLVY